MNSDYTDLLAERAKVAEPTHGIVPFPRSYVIALGALPELPAPINQYWVQNSIGPAHIAHDPILPVSHAEEGVAGVAVLGLAFDPELDFTEQNEIASRLLRSWISSRDALLEDLERLNGRYVVVYWDESGLYLQSDASSIRAVFYHSLKSIAAGNPNLIQELMRDSQPTVYSELALTPAKLNTYPGRRTNWTNVYLLNSNLELSLADRVTRRVGPRKIEHWVSPAQAARQITAEASKFLQYLRWLPNEVKVSLTAGMDSRVTLGLMHEVHQDFEFFTYELNWAGAKAISDMDMKAAATMAESFALNHRFLKFETTKIVGPEREVFDRNNRRAHGRYLTLKYASEFPTDAIHIRSTVYELGRARHGIDRDLGNFAEWMTKKIVNSGTPNGNILSDFGDYMNSSEFSEIPDTYLPQDMYYWEITDSSWMQHIVAESDHAFDTVVLINSRRMLRTLLSVPPEDRATSQTYIRMLDQNWPALLDVPVNGKKLSVSHQ